MYAADMLSAPPLPSQAVRPPSVNPTGTAKEIRDAAEDFESFFLSQMFEYMFAGIDTDGPFGGGHGEKIFRSLLLQEYGKAMARQGGIGVADTIERQLLQYQEVDK
ncbi:MAG: rod-binding protein [Alphaproteobacteria bacterium]|jgi:Rod binding domain-containing protein|nr:rod-binding protein [Alphaproteobacteria bacterium]MDP6515847.1 rod-binding protein [Alphaproteobacteria bacterium]|tara:strand:- start:475 stop:792 length:318 start_codon:yes stop_codon:yes gene_type:complete